MYFKDLKHLSIHYHKGKGIIAFELLKKGRKGGYTINLHKSGHGVINSQSFFKHYQIDTSKKRELEILEFNEEDKLIFLKVEGGAKDGR
jgi:hypothetical protein